MTKFCAQMILYRKVSVVSNYLPHVTSDCQILHTQGHLHVHVHVPEYGTIVEYTCTTFCATVWKFPSTSNLRRRKVLTLHGHALATLVSQTTCCLRLVFAAPRGDFKNQFLLYHQKSTRASWSISLCKTVDLPTWWSPDNSICVSPWQRLPWQRLLWQWLYARMCQNPQLQSSCMEIESCRLVALWTYSWLVFLHVH